MAFSTPRKLYARLPWLGSPHGKTDCDLPQRLFLPPSASPSKPTVRIYLGTEPGQYRAERVFVWSVLQHRDPTRGYEICVMKNLAGFDRRRWVTGFTNYRFAIAHYAGGTGRAIYNDVDQIYLRDPGELFDTPMNDHGFLSIHHADTSVMLIDCAKMAAIWPIEQARRQPRKTLEARALEGAGTWGSLESHWNAREEEYAPGVSRLVHFTTLHTQPWEPSPEQYVYQSTAAAGVWHELEASADMAGYEVYSSAQPSDQFHGACQAASSLPAGRPHDEAWLCSLVRQMGCGSVAICTAVAVPEAEAKAGLRVRHCRVGDLGTERLKHLDTDLVLCRDLLEHLPEDDWPWVIETLFAGARTGVAICYAGAGRRGRAERARRGRLLSIIQRVARRHPGQSWRYYVSQSAGVRAQLRRQGGPAEAKDGVRVWVLSDGKPGHDTQSIGLAQALGESYEVKRLRFGILARVQYRLLGVFGAIGANRLGVDLAAATLGPPWPNLVITSGWSAAPVARWIADKSLGLTRTVQLGRRGGRIARKFDYVVSCGYHRLPYASNRLLTVAPLNRISPERLAGVAQSATALFANRPKPYIVALVGGSSRRFRFDAADATEFGRQLRRLAQNTGGWVFALTSRRTGEAATAALASALGDAGAVDVWRPHRADNPYEGCLALADHLVVTGESESMLAEAASSGKPVSIFVLAEAPATRWNRLVDAVAARAQAQPRNRRGSIRPQQGLEYLCARLLEKGILQPRRDLRQLHLDLVARGIAGYLGVSDPPTTVQPLREADELAAELRRRMGLRMGAGLKTPAPQAAAGSGPSSRASVA